MFEMSAARVYATDAAQVDGAIPMAIYEASTAQVTVAQPAYWQGRSTGTVWGMHAEVTVRTMPGPQGTMVNVTVGAQPESSSIIVVVLLCFFFFPAAIVLGVLAYNDFTQRRTVVMEAVYGRLSAATGVPGLPVMMAPPLVPGAPPPHGPM